MPLLTMDQGFEQWYLDQLPEDVREEALTLLELQKTEILSLTDDMLIQQYYIPMGYIVSCRFTVGLAHAVYITELRTGTTVHPTARKVAQWMGESLKSFVGVPWFTLHLDETKDDLDMKRAKQDFIEKQ